MTSFLTSVHSSGRYLLDQNGQPFFVNGDAAWGIIGGYPGGPTTAQNATGWSTYATDRASNGFNCTLIDVGSGPDASGNQPFTTFPTLNAPYWASVDTMLSTLSSNGLSIYMGVADAYYLISQSWTAAQMTTYASTLAARYANKTTWPGIVWFFGNDYGGSGVGGGNPTNMDAKYEGFITGLNSQGDTRPITLELGYYESLDTDSATWATRVSFNTVYSYHPTYEATLRAYAYATKTLPGVFFEGAYENATTGFPDTPLDLRKLICWPLTSGSAGSWYGNDSLWPFASGWQSTLDTPGVAQRKIINAIFAGIAWWKLAPDTTNHLVTSGRGTQYTTVSTASGPDTNDATYGNYVTAAYAADGTVAMVYNPNSSSSHPVLSASVMGANPIITKIDPTNGATTNLGWTTTPSGGTNAGGDSDWLYLITAGAPPLAPRPLIVGNQSVMGAAYL